MPRLPGEQSEGGGLFGFDGKAVGGTGGEFAAERLKALASMAMRVALRAPPPETM